jgi:nucleolar protein 56
MADYLLFEAPMGYSLFKVVHQADTVGNSLKEVQAGVMDLGKFGKMIDLVSFLPFEYVRPSQTISPISLTCPLGTTSKL